MRITLQNYLNLTDVTIEATAKQIGRSRETVRSWRDNTDMQTIVQYNVTKNEIEQIEFVKRRILKVKK